MSQSPINFFEKGGNIMLNIVLATGVPKINSLFDQPQLKEQINVVALIEEREMLIPQLEALEERVDVILITDALPGRKLFMMQLLPNLRVEFHDIRVVYLTSEVNMTDTQRIQNLSFLVTLKLYDIVSTNELTPQVILRAIGQPATADNVGWITRYMEKAEYSLERKTTAVQMDTGNFGENDEENSDLLFPNVAVFASIKPGTGKSFISANIATTIAKYGVKNANGEPPRVALIDGDLQNLSLGTLLQYPDDENNLKNVMDKIHGIYDEDGKLKDNPQLINETNAYIRNAFVPYSKVKNLYSLVGSQLTMEQISGITGTDFLHLLKTIEKDFDIIIVDSNSSLGHISTIPLLTASNFIYYIINLDFNNIRNNARYFENLQQLQILDRVSYILNENVTEDYLKKTKSSEELKYTAAHIEESGFELAGQIPIIEKSVFLNHIYDGTPVSLDNEPYTLEARLELARIASQLWEIEKLPYLEEQYSNSEKIDQKAKRKGLFGK